jgi:hypothetical protein
MNTNLFGRAIYIKHLQKFTGLEREIKTVFQAAEFSLIGLAGKLRSVEIAEALVESYLDGAERSTDEARLEGQQRLAERSPGWPGCVRSQSAEVRNAL